MEYKTATKLKQSILWWRLKLIVTNNFNKIKGGSRVPPPPPDLSDFTKHSEKPLILQKNHIIVRSQTYALRQ